ncbi:DNA glycosylase [Microthyrium microscopicum]|uniref:DNA glycosylase n=1 Tax=Microthyrium microscopicum TaxID=703497 RepID=A0A6A6U082_9PEZI|nr:DNA glycosylase [Microthyrium microscopicum]
MKDPTILLKDRKLKAYSATAGQSPFPDFVHPTPAEAKEAHRILRKLHGARNRPKEVVASADRAGCGDSPSVLDALVRTILSQNTSDTNSTRAKRSMDSVYGRSDKWEAIAEGGQEKLEEAIRCGGLSKTKSKVILSILEQVKEKYGEYSLDHMFKLSNEDAMQEMLGFQGVGPKTASCVLLFCLRRESFAVDTHVHRIAGLLGWRPPKASRDETHAHLDVRIPDEDKYGLHILMVSHGKKCDECKAGRKNLGKCELRKAFPKSKAKDNVSEKKEKKEKSEDVKLEDDSS